MDRGVGGLRNQHRAPCRPSPGKGLEEGPLGRAVIWRDPAPVAWRESQDFYPNSSSFCTLTCWSLPLAELSGQPVHGGPLMEPIGVCLLAGYRALWRRAEPGLELERGGNRGITQRARRFMWLERSEQVREG